MALPPARTELSDDYPNPSNATMRIGMGKLWDYVTGLLGMSGNAVDARAALGAAADDSVVKLTGEQTVADIKTFSSSPVVPDLSTGDTSSKAANAKLVSDSIAAISRAAASDVSARTDSSKLVTPASLQGLVTRLPLQVTTSGTGFNITGIPSWANRITLTFSGVSTNGTGLPLVQVGDSGGIEATGYTGSVSVNDAGGVATDNYSGVGFPLSRTSSANAAYTGTATLTRHDGNTWGWSSDVADITNHYNFKSNGGKTLSGVLTQLNISYTGASTAFDAGSIGSFYE